MPEDMVQVPEGWELDGEPVVVPAEQVDSLREAMEAAAYIMRFIGGAVQMAPVRQEVKPGSKVYVTVEYLFRWNSFVPPVAAEDNGAAVEEPVAQAA